MTSAEIHEFLDRFSRAWEGQDVKALGACYADECTVVSPIFGTLRGRMAVEKSYADLVRVFGLQQVRVDDVVIGNEEPPRAVVVWTVESTPCCAPSRTEARMKPVSKIVEATL